MLYTCQMKALIYKLTSPSGNIYVGSTRLSLNERVVNHLSELRRRKHSNFILQAAWDKYGVLESSILEEFEYIILKDIAVKEQYWMDLLNPQYNILKQAYCPPAMSSDTRQKSWQI